VEKDWVVLDFEGVLATLQGWLGRVVRVSAETGQPDRPASLAFATGVLRASGSIFDPQGYDEDDFPFELHPGGDHLSGFALDRSWFHNAVLTRGGELLIVTIGAPEHDPAQAPQLYIGVHGDA
jgi:hypothetical protein